MFSNFIYFIAAILLIGAYEQHGVTADSLRSEILLSSVGITAFFFLFEYYFFRQLGLKSEGDDHEKMDVLYTRTSGLFSVSVLIIFGLFIYILNIPDYLSILATKNIITLKHSILLLFFILLICCHWSLSYPAYRRIYGDTSDLQMYIKSQLIFAVPVVIPWIILSGISDVINLLPFPGFRKWISSTEGELLFFVVLIVTMSFAAPFLIIKAWQCKPLKTSEKTSMIDHICHKTGIKFREILEWPLKGGNAITAGVMGVFSRFRYLLITPALLRSMESDEIGAVIAHEIGHVKYKHMLLYLVVIGSFSFTSIIASPSVEEILIFSGVLSFFSGQTNDFTLSAVSYIPGILSVVFFIIFIRFVFGFFMRHFERQADTYSVRVMGSPAPLVKAFYRIVLLTRQNPDKPSWHHFSISQRIDYVLRTEGSPELIRSHDNKVYTCLGLYLSVLLIIAGMSAVYERSEARDGLFRHFLTEAGGGKLKEYEIDQVMADWYYSKGIIEKSVFFYEQADMKSPDNPEILNALAWISATSSETKFKNPHKAVSFARRAIELKPDSPHIWDTLAESCFSAGDYAGAVYYAEKAIELAGKDDIEYYQGQLDRFRHKTDSGFNLN